VKNVIIMKRPEIAKKTKNNIGLHVQFKFFCVKHSMLISIAQLVYVFKPYKNSLVMIILKKNYLIIMIMILFGKKIGLGIKQRWLWWLGSSQCEPDSWGKCIKMV